MKLPETQRPPISQIRQQLNEKVPKYLQSIFIVDIQNDCDCNIETYDADPIQNYLLLDNENICTITKKTRIECPMTQNIDQELIINLLKTASKYAQHKSENTNKFILDQVNLNFLPTNRKWFLPSPEFFGVITVNINKFGAFCIPSNMFYY